jgi:hypothetical protein
VWGCELGDDAVVRTLLDEEYAPITSEIGFLAVPLHEATAAMETWRRRLFENVRVTPLTEDFPGVLHRLEPLTFNHHDRELFVQVGDEWTAFFDCGMRGTDSLGPVSVLSRSLDCRGFMAACEPNTDGREVPGRYGNVHFSLFGPENDGHFGNHMRAIQAVQDSRWEFILTGQEQWFEEPEAYSSRRVRDRFTSGMLERYSQALGVDVFNPDAYGPQAVLFESSGYIRQEPIPLPPGMREGIIPNPPGPEPRRTLAEAQAWLGIQPGLASQLPG